MPPKAYLWHVVFINNSPIKLLFCCKSGIFNDIYYLFLHIIDRVKPTHCLRLSNIYVKTLTSVTREARKNMAAEKLTKGRFLQIIFLMAVLITAFVWRTVTYEDTTTTASSAFSCVLGSQNCTDKESKKVKNISLTPLPAIANQPLVVQIDNTNVKPTAVVEGVSMFMGTIPVTFEQTATGWKGTFSVPECTHSEMEWAVKITQGEEEIVAIFTVKK